MYKKRKDRTVIVTVLETMKSRIVFSVFRVVPSHCVSRTKINTQKLNLADNVELATVAGYRIHKKLICPEHLTDNIDRKILLFLRLNGDFPTQ